MLLQICIEKSAFEAFVIITHRPLLTLVQILWQFAVYLMILIIIL